MPDYLALIDPCREALLASSVPFSVNTHPGPAALGYLQSGFARNPAGGCRSPRMTCSAAAMARMIYSCEQPPMSAALWLPLLLT